MTLNACKHQVEYFLPTSLRPVPYQDLIPEEAYADCKKHQDGSSIIPDGVSNLKAVPTILKQ